MGLPEGITAKPLMIEGYLLPACSQPAGPGSQPCLPCRAQLPAMLAADMQGAYRGVFTPGVRRAAAQRKQHCSVCALGGWLSRRGQPWLPCRWPLHLTLNAVNDGDLVFMHRQSQWLRQTEEGKHPGGHYYLPGESDRCASQRLSAPSWLRRHRQLGAQAPHSLAGC